jgi:molecular chaperone GrpE
MSDDKHEYAEDDATAPVGSTIDTTDEEADTIELSLEQVVDRLEADLAEARDAALRAQADAVNFQRRAEQEDNMERALVAAGESDAAQAIVEGVELTLKSFVDALHKNGVESIDPMGEPFDPQTAQAMSMIENPDVEPNTVIAVMQKGYRLNGRLIRPAMVMVSKAAG